MRLVSSRCSRWARGMVVGILSVFALSVFAVGAAHAGAIYSFSDVSGLSGEAEFTVVGAGDELEIRLRNTSTGVPGGFDESDQLLTGISWDFGDPGFNGDVMITGGSVAIGSASASLNFDNSPPLGPGADVSGEYGYGNMDGTGALTNFVSANAAVATPFGGANLDGPVSIDGPQAGLVANPVIVPLAGLGAIQDEILINLTLDGTITQQELVDDLNANGVRFEFGSDAAFFTVPEPTTALLLLAGLVAIGVRRER